MKTNRVVYWIGATLLVITLILVIGAAALFIEERHWPFGWIWGSLFVLLLVAIVIIGRRIATDSMAIDVIHVLPTNYRRIALQAISLAADPVVIMDGVQIDDFSEAGPVTQKGIRRCRDFGILDGAVPIVGFHDHPDEMWVSADFRALVDHCAAEGWMSVQRPEA